MAKRLPITGGIADIAKLLRDTSGYRHNLQTFHRDFISVSAIAYQNQIGAHDEPWQAREREYFDIVKRYDKDTLAVFANALGALHNLVANEGFDDHLGKLFMGLETNSKSLGQFFTPYQVSYLMASMTFNKATVEAAIEKQGFITMNEPSCGAGGMVIAAAQVLSDNGFNPAQHLRVTAQDIDLLCCRMTYFACVLHHIPAVIIHGDTIKMEERSVTVTPAFVLQEMSRRQAA